MSGSRSTWRSVLAVYTVVGNMTNSCKQRQYTVGYYEICGYGVPAYYSRQL